MKWIKASKKLPPEPDSPLNHFKLNGQKVNGNFRYNLFSEMEFVVISSTHDDYFIKETDFDRIEWLDESSKDDWKKAFTQGFVCACAVTLRNHGVDSIVEETLKCNFTSVSDLRKNGVDESDIKVLMPIIKEIIRKSK